VQKNKPSGLYEPTLIKQVWTRIQSEIEWPADAESAGLTPADEERLQKLLVLVALLGQETSVAELTEVVRQHGGLVQWQGSVNDATVRAMANQLRQRGLLSFNHAMRTQLHTDSARRRELLLAAYRAVDAKALIDHAVQLVDAGKTYQYQWAAQPVQQGTALCAVRALLWGGCSPDEVQNALRAEHRSPWVKQLVVTVWGEAWMPEMLDRIHPEWLDYLIRLNLTMSTSASYTQAQDWAVEALSQGRLSPSPALRLSLGMSLLADNRAAQAQALLGAQWWQVAPVYGQLVAAITALQSGDAANARKELLAVGKALRAAKVKPHEMMPTWVIRLELLAWLSSEDHKDWEQARKLCVAASGRRQPELEEGTAGAWVHAIDARMGKGLWSPRDTQYVLRGLLEPDAVLQLAWLGKPLPPPEPDTLARLIEGLKKQRHASMLAPVLEACERLGWPVPPWSEQDGVRPARLFGAPPEPWRDALQAVLNLGASTEGELTADKPALQWAWSLKVDEHGRPVDISLLEMSTGARGAVKLKPLGWVAAQKRQGLPARDSAVLRHLRRLRVGSGSVLSITGALQALRGHPCVMLEDRPQEWLELVAAQPRLRVKREGEGEGATYGFDIDPPLRLLTLAELPEQLELQVWGSEREEAKADRERWRILRIAPGVARLIQISPAQQQVADLIEAGWRVPAHAQTELNAALQALAQHFELQGDALTGRQVSPHSRLRAQLAPAGEGLTLRFVVQPFGDFGPVMVPGLGRNRLVCVHEGHSLWCERQLSEERRWLAEVLAQLPMLDAELSPDQVVLLDQAEEALGVLDLLPQVPGVAAIDWPKGRTVSLQRVDGSQLSIKVGSGRDWLALEGELQLDEGRVLSLQQLLGLMRGSAGRFVTLAEGQVLALSERLRQQLRDLEGLAQQSKKSGVQLPHAAAAWLSEQMGGITLEGDAAWTDKVNALAQASNWTPAVPSTLQAQLRDYQLQGFEWVSRLAQSGLGACLADDMGLGKTVQTLALLLQRAPLGPALVLAPTSVCSNWRDEIHRFAPSLQVTVYHEAQDRAQVWQALGPGQVLVASYGLALQDAEAFSAPRWASLVMDEAQALKNANTQRAQMVGQLQADFRLALSGTPVENRLSELWSLMSLLNPGLLGSQAQFQERFAGPIERQQDAAVRQRLRRIISPFLLRRTKAQVLQDLPPRTEIVHLVVPSEAERSLQEALRRQAREEVAKAAKDKKGPQMRMLAELMKLRRAACDPRLVVPEMGLSGAKIEEFERLVQELVAGQHKALVFSQFTDYLALLAERLKALGVAFQYLDGSTPAAERSKRVTAFQQGQGEVFLISLKAGGFGLNLTAADYVIIVDPWWNPAAEDQASGRAHRMGQQRPVTVYRLVTQGSIEERILAMHHDKRSLADSVLNDQDGSAVLDAQALAELLRD
jgi:superfamily II DNA or RNA helicase